MDGKSNLAEVLSRIGTDVNSLSFRGAGNNGTLADDIRRTVASVIAERTVDRQQQPDGKDLAPLKPRTLERKRRLGFPDTILVETGEMLSSEELMGEVAELSDHSLEMEYGLSDSTKVKAEWATVGNDETPLRAPRPFYEIGENEADRKAVDDTVRDGLDKQAKALWGGS